MRPLLCLVLAFVFAAPSRAQEAFDVAVFSPPKDWKRELRGDALVFSKTAQKGAFGVVTLYRSAVGAGDAKKDFEQVWNKRVKEALGVKDGPETQPGEANNGWQNVVGGAGYSFEGTPAIVLLSSFTSQGRVFSLIVVTNDQALFGEWDACLAGLKLAKPDTVRTGGTPKPAAGGGFAFVQTNFDDGWVATIETERVVVAKPDVRVLVCFPLAYDDASRQQGGHVHCWDALVRGEFRAGSGRVVHEPGAVQQVPYIEGTGTDPRTGKPCFLALYVASSSGRMLPTLAVATDEASFRRQFPKAIDLYASDLAAMRGYNRFAVASKDLVGSWVGSDAAAMDYYSSVTGNYLGMNAVSTSDAFEFRADGTYTSQHKGASGQVGTMSVFQQEFKGAFSVSNWAMTLDHRYEGKTEAYAAYFEAVRGGRILHLQNKQFTSSWYHLAKKG